MHKYLFVFLYDLIFVQFSDAWCGAHSLEAIKGRNVIKVNNVH